MTAPADTFLSIYPFISFRRETFGGFLFNPYRLNELTLNRFETEFITLCDGTRSLNGIIKELLPRCNAERSDVEHHAQLAFERFSDYSALKHLSKRAPKRSMPIKPSVSNTHPKAPNILRAPLSVLWELTDACNLNCRHCFSACGKNRSTYWDYAAALHLIDELAALKVFTLTLSGGEPLLHPRLSELIAYASERHLGIRLATNGTLVTDDFLKEIKPHNLLSAQVSIDGLASTHDVFREQSGSFQQAIEALQRFIAAGLYTVMTVTVSKKNHLQIPALIEIAEELGVSAIKISACAPLGRARNQTENLQLSHEEARILAQSVQEKKAQVKERLEVQCAGLFPWLLEKPPAPAQTDYAPIPGPECSAGQSSMVIAADGSVYPCVYMRTTPAGVAGQEPLKSIWNKESAFKALRELDLKRLEGKCAGCTYRPLKCTGGCRGLALAAFGNLYGEDPTCWHRPSCRGVTRSECFIRL